MKNFFKLMGVIAMVAVIGFSMAACGDEEDPDGGGDENFTYVVNYGGNGASKFLGFTFTTSGKSTSRIQEITVADIIITDGTGSVTKGVIERTSQTNGFLLIVTVNTPGTIQVKINKKGIESGTKTVTVTN